jgi:4-hydroxy-tetrahydrodipicolinate synthase
MFRGIVPPLVTPLSDRDRLDQAGLRRLIEHLLGGGVHGLFVLGTTGEAPSLSYRLRRDLIERVCDQVRGRAPVLVGITDTAFEESLALARHAAESGATAVVLATPYYFPAGQTELERYVRSLAAELPLPLILYNMPSLTKVWFESETLRRLGDVEQIIGIKDSSGDLEYFSRVAEVVRQVRPDWSLLIGPEHLLGEALALGGHGGVHGGANLYPRLFVDYWEALQRDDRERAERLRHAVQTLQSIYEIGKYASRFIKATKSGLSIKGICDDALAQPFDRFQPPERRRVAEVLSRVDRLLAPSSGETS